MPHLAAQAALLTLTLDLAALHLPPQCLVRCAGRPRDAGVARQPPRHLVRGDGDPRQAVQPPFTQHQPSPATLDHVDLKEQGKAPMSVRVCQGFGGEAGQGARLRIIGG